MPHAQATRTRSCPSLTPFLLPFPIPLLPQVYFIDLSVGIALAHLVAALSPNMDVANAALPGFVVTLLFFAGQLMTVDAIPVYWQWYSKIGKSCFNQQILRLS